MMNLMINRLKVPMVITVICAFSSLINVFQKSSKLSIYKMTQGNSLEHGFYTLESRIFKDKFLLSFASYLEAL